MPETNPDGRPVTMGVAIRLLRATDIETIYSAFATAGWHRPAHLLEGYLAEQEKGERIVFVAYSGHDFAGYVTVKWQSDYLPFAENNIPEIMDLNVLPPFRQRRIASRLVNECERLIFERSRIAGIGVGMFSDYGAAQRMYVRRGYVPDGLGLFYHGQHVKRGQEVRVDDDLILYLTKERTVKAS